MKPPLPLWLLAACCRPSLAVTGGGASSRNPRPGSSPVPRGTPPQTSQLARLTSGGGAAGEPPPPPNSENLPPLPSLPAELQELLPAAAASSQQLTVAAGQQRPPVLAARPLPTDGGNVEATLAQNDAMLKQYASMLLVEQSPEPGLPAPGQSSALAAPPQQLRARPLRRSLGRSDGTQLLQLGSSAQVQVTNAAALETSLEAREGQVAAREASVRQEAAELQAREVMDGRAEQQLDARATALAVQERQVGALQSQLLMEQRKIWKILSRRRPASELEAQAAPGEAAARPGVGLQQMAIAGSSASLGMGPPQPALLQLPPRQQPFPSQPLAFPQAMLSGAAQSLAQDPSQEQLQAERVPAAALMQVSNGATAQIAAAKTGTLTAASADAGDFSTQGSDLHVVLASKITPSLEDTGEDDSISGRITGAFGLGPSSDEDSGHLQRDDRTSEFADNDDLENILLQQERRVRRVGGVPVRAGGP